MMFLHVFFPLGRHSIAVILDGEPVKGSPFACNIYDVSKIKISGLGPTKVCCSLIQKQTACPLLK
jgi:hypothetical protein